MYRTKLIIFWIQICILNIILPELPESFYNVNMLIKPAIYPTPQTPLNLTYDDTSKKFFFNDEEDKENIVIIKYSDDSKKYVGVYVNSQRMCTDESGWNVVPCDSTSSEKTNRWRIKYRSNDYFTIKTPETKYVFPAWYYLCLTYNPTANASVELKKCEAQNNQQYFIIEPYVQKPPPPPQVVTPSPPPAPPVTPPPQPTPGFTAEGPETKTPEIVIKIEGGDDLKEKCKGVNPNPCIETDNDDDNGNNGSNTSKNNGKKKGNVRCVCKKGKCRCCKKRKKNNEDDDCSSSSDSSDSSKNSENIKLKTNIVKKILKNADGDDLDEDYDDGNINVGGFGPASSNYRVIDCGPDRVDFDITTKVNDSGSLPDCC